MVRRVLILSVLFLRIQEGYAVHQKLHEEMSDSAFKVQRNPRKIQNKIYRKKTTMEIRRMHFSLRGKENILSKKECKEENLKLCLQPKKDFFLTKQQWKDKFLVNEPGHFVCNENNHLICQIRGEYFPWNPGIKFFDRQVNFTISIKRYNLSDIYMGKVTELKCYGSCRSLKNPKNQTKIKLPTHSGKSMKEEKVA